MKCKNKEQKYDEEMIREEKRSEVEEELRRQVDVLMREELDLLKIVSIQSSNSAGKIIAYFLGCGKIRSGTGSDLIPQIQNPLSPLRSILSVDIHLPML